MCETIAQSLNRRFGTSFHAGNIPDCCRCGKVVLNVILKTLLNPGEQVITFAPYFVEYGSYLRNYDGELVVVSPNTVDFQPNLVEFEEKINEKTKAVIITPRTTRPGVIYSSEETLQKIAAILEKKQKEFGTSIVLLSDEPYRELAYDGAVVPYVTKYYRNTVVCYSYSKSLSLPGERIGYLVIPSEMDESANVFQAATIANRVLGCVNAPSLMQRVIKRCVDANVNLEAYDRNRNLLYNGLKECGFSCIKPEGAFYLFVKSPVENERNSASMQTVQCTGSTGKFIRVPGIMCALHTAYHMDRSRSLPAFRKIAEHYNLV